MSAAGQLLTRVTDALAYLAGAILAAVTVALVLNVGMRMFAGGPIFGVVDAIELGLMAATFLAAPWVLRQNAHVAVDLFVSALGPRGRRGAAVFSAVLGALLSAVFCAVTLQALGIAYARGSMIRGVLVLPEWVPLLAPAVGSGLLTLESLRNLGATAPGERRQSGL